MEMTFQKASVKRLQADGYFYMLPFAYGNQASSNAGIAGHSAALTADGTDLGTEEEAGDYADGNPVETDYAFIDVITDAGNKAAFQPITLVLPFYQHTIYPPSELDMFPYTAWINNASTIFTL